MLPPLARRTGKVTRLAIFSDIHGNAAGLRATLEHARAHGCTQFVCLGDVADGGEEGEECVRILRENQIPTVRGNHDEDSVCVPVSEESSRWLAALPLELRRGEALFTHIEPGGQERAINTVFRAASVFEDFNSFRLLFVGHLHYPAVFAEKTRSSIEAALPQWRYNRPFDLGDRTRHIICPGSIGYPRDGLRKLRYAILDEASSQLTLLCLDGPLLDLGV